MNDGIGASRIVDADSVEARCERLRAAGARIVFTNGCFDLLHAGHVTYLEAARALGDALVVGLNSDASVRRLKGSHRPILPEHDRAVILAALRSVDAVCVFDQDTPLELIRRVRPDVLVKGGDYDPEAPTGRRHIVGSELVRDYGGDVRAIPVLEGRSTTDIVARILSTR